MPLYGPLHACVPARTLYSCLCVVLLVLSCAVLRRRLPQDAASRARIAHQNLSWHVLRCLIAGLDLYACKDFNIPPRTRLLVPTGIKVKLPIGTYGRVAPRSGLSLKGIDVAAGVIDRDYTGEIRVLLVNNSDFNCIGKKGDRIAQLVIERIATVDIEQVDSIGQTARGDKGFGSTGI